MGHTAYLVVSVSHVATKPIFDEQALVVGMGTKQSRQVDKAFGEVASDSNMWQSFFSMVTIDISVYIL